MQPIRNSHRTSEQPDTGPPHSDESEVALLHSLLNGCDIRGAKLEMLEPGHFYHMKRGWLYDGMQELAANGKTIDVITLTERMKERGELGVTEDEIRALKEAKHEGAMAVRSYAKTIKAKFTRRMMLKRAGELATMALDESVDPGVQLARHERSLVEIRPFDLNQEFVEGKDSASRHVKLLEDQAKTQVWHSMPWGALANRAPVLSDGDVAVVVAPEGSGKSAFLAQWAQFEAEQGTRSVYIHTEMNDKAVFDRRAVNANKALNFNKLQKPDALTDHDWAEIVNASGTINKFTDKLDYWHSGPIPEARLLSVMQHLVDTFGTRAFFLDYVNDVGIEKDRGTTGAESWRNFFARLEDFNNRNHCITVTAAQLNKEGEAYAIGRALRQKVMLYLKIKPEELKTELTFSYENVTYRYAPGDYHPRMKVLVEKYRAGGRGAFDLLFVGPRYLWTDVPAGFDGGKKSEDDEVFRGAKD